jgi:hypothetical protein
LRGAPHLVEKLREECRHVYMKSRDARLRRLEEGVEILIPREKLYILIPFISS